MRKPLIHGLMIALVFLSSACGNAKFNGKGKKKDKKNADVVEVVVPPAECKSGETCVVTPECKTGDANCPTVPPPKTDCNEGDVNCTTPPVPPKDDCKEGDTTCPVVPPVDTCDDEPGQNPSQNHDEGKECPTQNDNAGQNNPVQNK